MLVQRLQRPTRLLAFLTSLCLVYLCFNYLQRVDFAETCNSLRLADPFGIREGASVLPPLIGMRPSSVPKGKLAKVAKVGVAVNALDIPVVHRALKTHQLHNDMHGYPHYIADRELVSDMTDHDRMHRGSGAYTKPAYLLAIVTAELLKSDEDRLEWLFWFDGDTAVLNPSTPLETFLPPNSSEILNDVHMVIASNWDGLNSGAFALRIHPWTASFLSGVLAYPLFERARTMKDRFRDQSAIQFLLTNQDSPLARDFLKHKNHWAKVPMRWFNSLPVNNAFYSDGKWLFAHGMSPAMFDNGTTDVFNDGRDGKIQPWKVMQGDMIVHFPGTKGVRDSWMTPWLDRAEALLPEWNNPNTTDKVAIEVNQYWQDYEEQMRAEIQVAKDAEEKEKQKKKEEEKKKLEEKKKNEERKKIEKEKKMEEDRKKEEEKKKKQEEEKRKKEEEEKKKKVAEESAAAAPPATPAPTAATGESSTPSKDAGASDAKDLAAADSHTESNDNTSKDGKDGKEKAMDGEPPAEPPADAEVKEVKVPPVSDSKPATETSSDTKSEVKPNSDLS